MGGKRKAEPGVRVICTDQYHRDSEEFARRGFRFLHMMELRPLADGGYSLSERGISPAAVHPVKPVAHGDDGFLYQFKCSCGRDLQRRGNNLVGKVLSLIAATGTADPLAARVDLDITAI